MGHHPAPNSTFYKSESLDPQEILRGIESFYSLDLGGNLVGRYTSDLIMGSAPFRYEGHLAVSDPEFAEQYSDLLSTIDQIGQVLNINDVLGVDVGDLATLDDNLFQNERAWKTIQDLLKKCTYQDLTHFFIDCGLCTHCTAGFISNRLEVILKDFPQEIVYDQALEYMCNANELALLNILLFTGKESPTALSTLDTILSQYETKVTEKTLSTRPKSWLTRNYLAKRSQIEEVRSALNGNTVELLFNPESEPLNHDELQIFMDALYTLHNSHDRDIYNFVHSLAGRPSTVALKLFTSPQNNQFNSMFESMMENPDFQSIAEKVLGVRLALTLSRELSGYIRARMNIGAMPLKGRPDALLMNGLTGVNKENGSLRTLDEIYSNITNRYAQFIEWLELHEPDLAAHIAGINENILEFDVLNETVTPYVRDIQDLYGEFLEKNNLDRLNCEINLFELKTGDFNEEKTIQTQRRRLLILLYSLYAESRLPYQSLQQWLISQQNPLTILSILDELKIGHTIFKMLGRLEEYRYLKSDAYFAPSEEFLPYFIKKNLLEELNFIVQEIPPLVHEVTEDLIEYKRELKRYQEKYKSGG